MTTSPYMYYWILAFHEGRPIILGPCNSESEARSIGYSKLQCEFDIYPLATRDESKATRELKAKILEKTASMNQALAKFKHGN